MTEKEKILAAVKDHRELLGWFEGSAPLLSGMAAAVSACFAAGGRLLICGNGGSAADSQHIAGEFVGRFKRERRAAAAIALSSDTSILTCLGNDYGFDTVFERQVEAYGRPGDVLLGISTSGNSANVVKAAVKAKAQGMKVLGFLGCGGGKLAPLCDIAFSVPSKDTPRVQEMHGLAMHCFCALVEETL